MRDSLHADMCDLTLAERLGNKDVTTYEVRGITDYSDITRIQAFCDAQNRVVLWEHRRNHGEAIVHVVTTP